MRDITVLLNDLQSRCPGVASICAQMLASPDRWTGSLNDDDIEHSFELRNIMAVSPGHDERQRDAMSVHQQMAFDPQRAGAQESMAQHGSKIHP